MPELPDVEVNLRYLDATALHRRVAAVHVSSPEVLEDTSAQGLGRRLHGRRLLSTRRHGKYLFARLDDDDSLVVHFGMTGYLAFFESRAARPEYTACEIDFEDGSALCYVAPRKLGLVAITSDVDVFIEQRGLGADALALDKKAFHRLGEGRRGSVKSWLTNQQVVAGIGNVYADEMLFAAGIRPDCNMQDLGKDRLDGLYRAMCDVLNRAIEARADADNMPDDFILPYRQDGACCPRCGGTLQRLEISGRSTWYCPVCQPAC